ncbi:MAG TPA: peptidase M16 [Solibacterales bacterium]|nr:peptidase M16 [Bryobacterales bacterium]
MAIGVLEWLWSDNFLKIKLALLALAATFSLGAQNLKEFQKSVTEFTLANGLHFIVVERHQSPVASFHTYVGAGAVNDPDGKTGLAHMFEHMAFKGTDSIGSRNWPEEKKALGEVERQYDRLDAARRAHKTTDAEKLAGLQADLKNAVERANDYVESNLYPGVIESSGGVGMNAGTGEDSTNFFYSLPSNRSELWFLLESARFLHPVYREFYKERDVVREERRMRTESNPQGKLIEVLTAATFIAHPYHRPAIGWASDVENLRVSDAEKFFNTFYAPANMVIAIVGDVQPEQMKRMAEKYFGPLPARPLPPDPVTVEPPQAGPRRVVVDAQSQPIEFITYHRPSALDKDDPVFDVISGILSSGRTGLMYKQLVRDKRIALEAGADADFPGGKFPNAFLFYLVPAIGHSDADNDKALEELIDGFKSNLVDDVTLKRVKTVQRANLIRQLDSNSGLASLLTMYHGLYGDWRKLFTSLDDVDRVTAADVQRVARQYFVPQNRTVAVLRNTAGGAQ